MSLPYAPLRTDGRAALAQVQARADASAPAPGYCGAECTDNCRPVTSRSSAAGGGFKCS
jgi:hypothetical protein